ncbi:hypothetical protein FHL15_004244 [Xylaria flabelliformis]|uniref:Uncharacterized protein n=1 Tax=Xylaria flabelliformis TaxID=2512241 RepID=A0A553I3L2_9PEZI|nr:hypothetical protein FHL15_004244 [Xylaria flabelliformis]
MLFDELVAVVGPDRAYCWYACMACGVAAGLPTPGCGYLPEHAIRTKADALPTATFAAGHLFERLNEGGAFRRPKMCRGFYGAIITGSSFG